jgi:hypothetical protein
LTGPEFLFMFAALAILHQMRDQLLASDFTNVNIDYLFVGHASFFRTDRC